MEAVSPNILPLNTQMTITSISKGWTAETIRIARKARQLTQSALAEELGCRQQTISEWEQGMYTPKNAYQKLLDHFFAAKDGMGAAQEEQTPAPAVPLPECTPALEPNRPYFVVTADELEGAAKHMRSNGLLTMQIQHAQAQATFKMFGFDAGEVES